MLSTSLIPPEENYAGITVAKDAGNSLEADFSALPDGCNAFTSEPTARSERTKWPVSLSYELFRAPPKYLRRIPLKEDFVVRRSGSPPRIRTNTRGLHQLSIGPGVALLRDLR
jgi:hypothetical protein